MLRMHEKAATGCCIQAMPQGTNECHLPIYFKVPSLAAGDCGCSCQLQINQLRVNLLATFAELVSWRVIYHDLSIGILQHEACLTHKTVKHPKSKQKAEPLHHQEPININFQLSSVARVDRCTRARRCATPGQMILQTAHRGMQR